jgi:hypothetical protein
MVKKYMKKMFNILSQGNANQNNTEIPSHNGYHEKTRTRATTTTTNGGEDMGKGTHILLVGCKLVQPLWQAIWRFLKN